MSLLNDVIDRRRFSRSLAVAAVAPIVGGFGRIAHAQTRHDTPESRPPTEMMSEFLNAFHFYADDVGRQVEANHRCTHLTEDFHQCVIYDSDRADAKLIGIEYIVSERAFKALPEEEKRLWHSHHYEVKSGELVAPSQSAAAEHAFMKSLVTSYGKTWHTWQIDRHPSFPTGIPQLMMGFTRDGQVHEAMVEDRDRHFGVSSSALKRARGDIPWPSVDPKANAWEGGTTPQLALQEVAVKNLRK